MPVYNAAAFLAPAIDSILAQSHRDFRFVIVDDGSTDGSDAIIARYAARDGRIVPLRRPNGGVTAALNSGLAPIESTYTARMDADDIALPERFARQLARLEAEPDLAVLGTRVDAIDRGGRKRHARAVITGSGAIAAALPFRNAIIHPSVMMRTAVLRAAGGYRERFPNSQDYDLWLRLMANHRLDNLPDPLLLYRTYEGRASSSHNRTRQTTFSVAAAADFFARRYGLPVSDAPIDTAEPTDVTAALAALLALDLAPTDREAIYRHALRLIRYGASGATIDALTRRMRLALAGRREFGQLLKLLLYQLQRQASPAR